jgi:UDP-N-acetylmuramate--alanine ligase
LPFIILKKPWKPPKGSREQNGITVIDDYGHHPTEIKTTLQALDENWPDRRKVIVFQPHRYTRTQALFDEFTRAFYQSDLLVVLPIYSAGEPVIEGLSSQMLCDGINAHGHKEVHCAEDFKQAVTYLQKVLTRGDILLTLGAGDVWKVGMEFLKK